MRTKSGHIHGHLSDDLTWNLHGDLTHHLLCHRVWFMPYNLTDDRVRHGHLLNHAALHWNRLSLLQFSREEKFMLSQIIEITGSIEESSYQKLAFGGGGTRGTLFRKPAIPGGHLKIQVRIFSNRFNGSTGQRNPGEDIRNIQQLSSLSVYSGILAEIVEMVLLVETGLCGNIDDLFTNLGDRHRDPLFYNLLNWVWYLTVLDALYRHNSRGFHWV